MSDLKFYRIKGVKVSSKAVFSVEGDDLSWVECPLDRLAKILEKNPAMHARVLTKGMKGMYVGAKYCKVGMTTDWHVFALTESPIALIEVEGGV